VGKTVRKLGAVVLVVVTLSATAVAPGGIVTDPKVPTTGSDSEPPGVSEGASPATRVSKSRVGCSGV
jgi:hypothetical protein